MQTDYHYRCPIRVPQNFPGLSKLNTACLVTLTPRKNWVVWIVTFEFHTVSNFPSHWQFCLFIEWKFSVSPSPLFRRLRKIAKSDN